MKLLLLLFISCVWGFSSPIPPTCDAEANYGCTEFGDDGSGGLNRLNCTDGNGGIMDWAWAPEFVPEIYQLYPRNGDSRYHPGRPLFLNLEVLEYGYQFRGILMYAEDSAGNRVGNFEVLSDDRNYYAPEVEEGHYCEKTVLHLSAQVKPTLSIFRYVPPPSGTGTITFKTLIKFGDPNDGAFYRPNSAWLTMEEGGSKGGGKSWKVARPGKSCSEVCENDNKVCAGSYMDSIDTPQEYEEKMAPYTDCGIVGFASCEKTVPAKQEESSICYYMDQTCENGVKCGATSNDVKYGTRLCACEVEDPDYTLAAALGGTFGVLAVCLCFFAVCCVVIVVVALVIAIVTAVATAVYGKGQGAILAGKLAGGDTFEVERTL